ncbi:hypothetical protein TKK_0018242 [Trichogramma kaykai]|uniref:Zinc carboxypeptidase A 1 n=1 Tax=Trichogramma kaykai TaxID=54128 RepID=A0ABD2VZB9_9HYME
MWIKLLLVALVATLSLADKERFDGFKVFRVVPSTDEHVDILKQLTMENGYAFWTYPTKVNQPVDVMVSQEKLNEFYKLMESTRMKYEEFIEDVQRLIDTENPHITREDFGYSHKKYHTLDEIYQWFELLTKQYPDLVSIIEVGKTYEGRTIKGVKISYGSKNPGIFIEGGIHAREWISPATVTYLIDQFLTSTDSKIRKLAESHDWYMVPSVNPDGYVYTHEKNRMWRKTRSGSGLCKGADANRNWGFMWNSGGASSIPCLENYAGKGPFSEIETKTLSQYLASLKGKLFAYISFHSYSQLLMFPYGHTTKHLDNHEEEKAIGMKAIGALAERYGTQYVTGNIAETIYVASGNSMDWVKATLKLPVTYTYELRDKGRYGFLLPADQIIPNGEEVMDSLVTMFDEAIKFGYPKPTEE